MKVVTPTSCPFLHSQQFGTSRQQAAGSRQADRQCSENGDYGVEGEIYFCIVCSALEEARAPFIHNMEQEDPTFNDHKCHCPGGWHLRPAKAAP